MAETTLAPRFRSLEPAEIEEILQRNHVGRLAYARGAQVDILPIHYVFDSGWIYGRTSPGAKIEATSPWHPVAFEVDEVEGLYDWRSVVVRGGFYIIPEDGAAWEHEVRMKAVGLLRRLVPATFRDEDPTPERTLLFRIAAQEAAGRAASTTTT
jgi:uncharacterized protein